ncbi:unnamed protein product [Closterium sp. NIES-64]|nr:unnamed protein product [Closterium sp. NIES-64]
MSLNLFPPLTAEFLVAGGVPFGGYPQQHPYPMYPLQGYPMSPFGYPQQFQEGAGYGFPQGVFPPYGPQGFPAQPGMFVPPVGTATPGAMYPGYPPAAFGPTQAAQAAGGFPGGPSMMPSATQPAGVAGVAGVGAAAQPFGFQQMQGGQPQGFQGTGEQQQMGGASQLAGGPGAQTSQDLPVIKDLIAATGLVNSNWMKAKPHLVYVLVYDLVVSGKLSIALTSPDAHAWGPFILPMIRPPCPCQGTLGSGAVQKGTLGSGAVQKVVLSHKAALRAALARVLVKQRAASVEELLAVLARLLVKQRAASVEELLGPSSDPPVAALVKQGAASVEELLGPSNDPPVAACESHEIFPKQQSPPLRVVLAWLLVKQRAASVEELLGPSNHTRALLVLVLSSLPFRPHYVRVNTQRTASHMLRVPAYSPPSLSSPPYVLPSTDPCNARVNTLRTTTTDSVLAHFQVVTSQEDNPRYARVNTLRTTSDSVLVHFQAGTPQENGGKEGGIDAGASSKSGDGESGASSSAESAGLRVEGEVSVQQDELIPDVLVFPPGTELHRHALVEKGDLILQVGAWVGRASCFPAFILAPRPGWHVLDACAAPGNKTSHLAALMANTGRLTACERDAKRAALLRKNLDKAGVTWRLSACERDAKRATLLQKNLEKAGVTCAHVHEGDFLAIDPASPEFADVSSSHLLSSDPCVVQAILLNPSEETCSFLNGNPLRSNEGFETQQVVWSPLKPLRGDLLLSQWGLVVRPCVACVLLHPSLSPNSRAGGRGSKGGESGRRGGGRGGGRGEGRGEGRGGGRGGGRDGGRGGGRGGKEEGNGGIEGAEASSGRQGEDERVERLARFQEAALRHALSFPAAQRVTYSTCSVNERENEAVVAAVLPLKPLPSAERITYSTCSINERENEAVVAAVLPAALSCGFRLAPALPAWPRRGMLSYPFGHQVVRTDPATDGTDGFFVALFERHVAGVADVAGAADSGRRC